MAEEIRSVHLQAVGRVRAAEAQELSAGDQVMWNGGSVSRVTAVREVSAAFLVATLVSERGEVHERRFKKTRLVALAAPLVSQQ